MKNFREKSNTHFSNWNFLCRVNFICCVFQPANRCSTCHSLIKIICLWVKRLVDPFYDMFFWLIFAFFTFMMEKHRKSCFSVKKMISTSEQHAKHPFVGQNTQHIWLNFGEFQPRLLKLISIINFSPLKQRSNFFLYLVWRWSMVCCQNGFIHWKDSFEINFKWRDWTTLSKFFSRPLT